MEQLPNMTNTSAARSNSSMTVNAGGAGGLWWQQSRGGLNSDLLVLGALGLVGLWIVKGA